MRASSGTCRSAFQKNCASRSRAVSTRSELRLISSGRSTSTLVTARNAGLRRPWSSTTGT